LNKKNRPIIKPRIETFTDALHASIRYDLEGAIRTFVQEEERCNGVIDDKEYAIDLLMDRLRDFRDGTWMHSTDANEESLQRMIDGEPPLLPHDIPKTMPIDPNNLVHDDNAVDRGRELIPLRVLDDLSLLLFIARELNATSKCMLKNIKFSAVLKRSDLNTIQDEPEYLFLDGNSLNQPFFFPSRGNENLSFDIPGGLNLASHVGATLQKSRANMLMGELEGGKDYPTQCFDALINLSPWIGVLGLNVIHSEFHNELLPPEVYEKLEEGSTDSDDPSSKATSLFSLASKKRKDKKNNNEGSSLHSSNEPSSIMSLDNLSAAYIQHMFSYSLGSWEIVKEYDPSGTHIPTAWMVVSYMDDNGEIEEHSMVWPFHKMFSRLGMIREMFSTFSTECSSDGDDLDRAYPPISDPLYDAPSEELVGAGYLFLNSLVYMIEMKETIPLINFKGYPCGSLDVSARIWIDSIESDPDYLGLDNEAHVRDFMGHNMVLRIQLGQIRGLPTATNNNIFCCFKFFSHAIPYSTPQFLLYFDLFMIIIVSLILNI